jgi:hypothetical protein
MYVDMLSGALEAWGVDMSGEDLFDLALECRVRMLGTGTAHGATAYEALAAEIAYDRALIRLCDHVGIGASLGAFDQPHVERARLERCLADQADIDLVGRSRSTSDNAVPQTTGSAH